jgi:predicted secreted hydrolase
VRRLLVSLAAVWLAACAREQPAAPEPALSERLGAGDAAGFARALEVRPFSFPADHAAHPEFRNEWWYFTGNLASEQGRRFGYQLTLFRIALQPQPPERPSAWATRDVWMGHLAISDADAQRHREAERFARGAAGLAGARPQPLRIWLEDWTITATDEGDWTINAATDDLALALELRPLRAPVLQGDRGLSRKSAEPGNASYYYSIPRLATRGRLRLDDAAFEVAGLSWLDREWSTSALAPDQEGWDWFALQFADGRDLMYYRLRRLDGSTDPLSAGSLVEADGTARPLDPERVQLEPLRWWTAADGTRYPVAWRMTLDTGETLTVDAVFDDQRMDVSVRYWEGMVTVAAADGEPVGRGYLELAGY